MNSEALFNMALGLHTPWQVNDVTVTTDESARSELHLRIGFAAGSRFPDEMNGRCSIHDTVERQWQYLSFFEQTCCLNCAVPRITSSSGKLRINEVPWARRHSGVPVAHLMLANHGDKPVLPSLFVLCPAGKRPAGRTVLSGGKSFIEPRTAC